MLSASRSMPGWRPELYGEIRSGADTLFVDGDLEREDFTTGASDVTSRFLMECMRVRPVAPMSVRNMMNTCVGENYGRPEGSQGFIAQSASHYMSDVYLGAASVDIDCFLATRKENISPGTPRWAGHAHMPRLSGGQNCSWLSIY